MTKKEQAFLKDYFELCEKHRMYITACGCCESPFLLNVGDVKTKNEYMAKHKAHMCGVKCPNKTDDFEDEHYSDDFYSTADGGVLECATCGTKVNLFGGGDD